MKRTWLWSAWLGVFLMSAVGVHGKSAEVAPVETVLILYRSSQNIQLLQPFRENRAEIQKVMIQSLRMNESLVFKKTLLDRASKRRSYWIANATAMEVTSSELEGLRQNPHVAAIVPVKNRMKLFAPVSNDRSLLQNKFTYGLRKIGLPQLQAQYPHLNGSGVKVGIIDTGIDATHPDLQGRLHLYRDFVSETPQSPRDSESHGTHVAGTIAGGSASGTAIGIAPQASLVVARNFNAKGEADDESLLKALQWMADPDGDPTTDDGVRVINNSWGDSSSYTDITPEEHPYCITIDHLKKLGIAAVFSAGNEGPDDGTVGTPAGCPNAISVAATDYNDEAPYFSSRGPAKWRFQRLFKPEISAPGTIIWSAKPKGEYQWMSGTSMASPHVVGAIAILLQAKPTITVDQIIQALSQGAADLGTVGSDPDYGVGRINVFQSIERLLSHP